MRKIVCIIGCILLACINSHALDLSAKSAILFDCTTGNVVYEKNADERSLIASTTKIMTAVVAAENYDINQTVQILPEWCGAEGSSMYLAAGESVTVKELLYGLMLMSGNDAAQALSCIYSGISADFVELMNNKALELGLSDTRFSNPSGLDEDDHYSTAKDLAMLAGYALSNDTIASVCATKQTEAAGRFMSNHNKLLFTIPGACGVKTGYTDEAGRCLVSAVERNGRMLIAVTLNAPDDWNDHEKLYDMGFYDMRVRDIIKAGTVGYANIASGGQVKLHIAEDIKYCLTAAEIDRIDVSLKGDRIVYGGHNAGDKYGDIIVTLDGTVICQKAVYYSEDIEECSVKPTFWDRIKDFFTLR